MDRVVGRTAKFRSADSVLVDLYLLVKTPPSAVKDLGNWIADLQSTHAQYQKAVKKEARLARGTGVVEGQVVK